MTTALVSQALFRAVATKRPAKRLIHHSDRGSQYCAHAYRKQLQQFGMHGLQRRAFSPEAVRALQYRLRKNFLPLVDAAQLLGQTKAQFQKTWISTGVMRYHYFSRKVLIQRVDLERAELIWRDFGSSSSIAAALNRDFWLCHAQEKMGQMRDAGVRYENYPTSRRPCSGTPHKAENLPFVRLKQAITPLIAS